jgi:hypothetical protein
MPKAGIVPAALSTKIEIVRAGIHRVAINWWVASSRLQRSNPAQEIKLLSSATGGCCDICEKDAEAPKQ